jgi:hypothetical protein
VKVSFRLHRNGKWRLRVRFGVTETAADEKSAVSAAPKQWGDDKILVLTVLKKSL